MFFIHGLGLRQPALSLLGCSHSQPHYWCFLPLALPLPLSLHENMFLLFLRDIFFLLEVLASQTQTAMYTNENQRLLVSVPDFIPFLLRYSFHVKMKNIPNNDRGGGQGCSYCVPVMKVFRDGENTGL